VLYIDIESAEWHVINNMISLPKIITWEYGYANYINPYKKEIENWMAENSYEILDVTDTDIIQIRK